MKKKAVDTPTAPVPVPNYFPGAVEEFRKILRSTGRSRSAHDAWQNMRNIPPTEMEAITKEFEDYLTQRMVAETADGVPVYSESGQQIEPLDEE